MKKILVATSSFASMNRAPMEKLEKHGFEVVNNPYGRKLTEEELMALLPGVVGSIAGLEPLTRRILSKSDLKVISRCGIGLDNVDLEAAREFGIQVLNTPDAPTLAVAEMTVGMMLTLPRRIKEMDQALHDGRWEKKIGMQLSGKTVAIIGYGRIGRKVAEFLSPFNVRILVVDPMAQENLTVRPLETALPESDFISLHASGNSVILGAEQMGMLKTGAFLFNAARGELINEPALIDALDKGLLSGAWLDTFQTEPYEGPLVDYPQVIMTPHVGTYSAQCRFGMEMAAVNNLIDGLRSHG